MLYVAAGILIDQINKIIKETEDMTKKVGELKGFKIGILESFES